VAVVRPGEDPLTPLLGELGYRLVTNSEADLGLGSSLAAGVRAARGADGWVIALADMPWVAPASIAAVAKRLRHGASIVAPVYGGRRGHPVGLASHWFADLAGLAGDQGARQLINEHPEAFTAVEIDDAGVIQDVDVPADLLGDPGRTRPVR
jgi:molybdenum cofactor cytidylyltransferase